VGSTRLVSLAILVLVPVAAGLVVSWLLLGLRFDNTRRWERWRRFAVIWGPIAAAVILVVELVR
jgi:hypothetical protein